jgi:hypothetical protein
LRFWKKFFKKLQKKCQYPLDKGSFYGILYHATDGKDNFPRDFRQNFGKGERENESRDIEIVTVFWCRRADFGAFGQVIAQTCQEVFRLARTRASTPRGVQRITARITRRTKKHRPYQSVFYSFLLWFTPL